jgi:hypothetical protein
VPFFFNYTVAYTLQLRKSKEDLSRGSRLVLHTSRYVDLAAFLGADSAGLLSISPPRFPVSDCSQPLVGRSAFQVAELSGSPHRLTSSQCSDVVCEERNPQIYNCLLLTYQSALVTM